MAAPTQMDSGSASQRVRGAHPAEAVAFTSWLLSIHFAKAMRVRLRKRLAEQPVGARRPRSHEKQREVIHRNCLSRCHTRPSMISDGTSSSERCRKPVGQLRQRKGMNGALFFRRAEYGMRSETLPRVSERAALSRVSASPISGRRRHERPHWTRRARDRHRGDCVAKPSPSAEARCEDVAL